MKEDTRRSEAHIALTNIKEAEEKAKRIIQDAREKTSAQIIQDAYDEAEKMKDKYLTEARKRADERKNVIILKARKETEKIKKKSEKEIAIIRQKAKTTMPEAVEKITEKLREFLKGGSL